jgi:hypothetical protein
MSRRSHHDYSPLPLAGAGEGGARSYASRFGCTTLIRLRHLLPPAGEGKIKGDSGIAI